MIWIKAEIVKLNHYSKTGHCYPSLVEKRNGKVIAELQGTIWNNDFHNIDRKFREIVGEPLQDNMTVVFLGHVTYHPVHGIAVNISEMDPEYTLGQLAREKALTIEKLQQEGVFEANKQMLLPRLPKTIAIISVESSKGYQDFLDVLSKSSTPYRFHHLLFPAILQGERATATIKAQLDRIRNHTAVFDAVAVIRGGGGEVGLSCFDDYSLAKKICTFPIPVLTGIGHSTNLTVSEMVSHSTCITPTRTAEFLVQKFRDFEGSLEQIEYQMGKEVGWLFSSEKSRLRETSRLYYSLAKGVLQKNNLELQNLSQRFLSETQAVIQDQRKGLKDLVEKLMSAATNELKATRRDLDYNAEKLELLSPRNVLRRGYSISRQNGKIIKDIRDIDPSEDLETELLDGKIFSKITRTQKEN